MKPQTAILDGREVPAPEIDPAKHVFVGTFRYPTPAQHGYTTMDSCPECQQGLGISGMRDIRAQHWREGHLDLPQYATRNEK